MKQGEDTGGGEEAMEVEGREERKMIQYRRDDERNKEGGKQRGEYRTKDEKETVGKEINKNDRN